MLSGDPPQVRHWVTLAAGSVRISGEETLTAPGAIEHS